MTKRTGKPRIEPHQGTVKTACDFSMAFGFINMMAEPTLETSRRKKFIVQAAESAGRKVIRFRQGGREYARAYECCWGHYYNCNRTRIGMYCAELDAAARAWFQRKVAELKAEIAQLPADCREQLTRELKRGTGVKRTRTNYDEEKLKAAAEDVVYEVETMLFAANHLETGHSSPAVEPEGKENDVYLEAFLLHYRNLRAFLCPSLQGVDPDDVLASDFLGEKEPRHLADALILDKERTRMNKSLAHISYRRKRYAEEGNKWWPVEQMRDEMMAAFAGFIDNDSLPAERRAWFLSSRVLCEALQLAREQQG